jgi:hypothetical protein
MDLPDDARAAAVVDWDGDGKLDVWIKNRTAPRLRFFHNQSDSKAHWLEVDLEGTQCNRDAIGARVTVELEGRRIEKSVHAGGGFLAQSSKRLHFGLGDATSVKSLTVQWPGGGQSRFEKVAADGLLRIRQGADELQRIMRPVPKLADRAEVAPKDPLQEVSRFSPIHKLPMAELGLPSYANPKRKVSDLVGRPCLIILWSLDVPACRAALEQMSENRQLSTEIGLRMVPMNLDASDRATEARELLTSLGLEENAGEVDAALLLGLEVLLTNVRGGSAGLQLPTSLLLDQVGQLVAVYQGRLEAPRISFDLQVLRNVSPQTLLNSELMGGQWLFRLRRDYTKLVSGFANIGRTDLAAFYGSLPTE